jgi:hypothetical protein
MKARKILVGVAVSVLAVVAAQSMTHFLADNSDGRAYTIGIKPASLEAHANTPDGMTIGETDRPIAMR